MRKIAYYLFLATIFSFPFEDVLLLPGVGTISRTTGLAVFGAWVLSMFTAGQMKRPQSLHILIYGLVFWMGLSFFWSVDPGRTAATIRTFFQLLLLMMIAWDLCDTSEKIRAALQSLVFGLWISAFSGLINVARGIQTDPDRFATTGADPNFIALALATGVAIALYLTSFPSNHWIRISNIAYVPVAVVSIALTGSRTGAVASVIVVLYIITTFRRMGPASLLALAASIIAAGFLISSIVPEAAIDRISSTGSDAAGGELNGRVEIWIEAKNVFVQNPLIGIGAGASKAALNINKVGHNVPVTIAVELGLVGLTLLLAAMVTLGRRAWSLPKADRRMWLAILAIWGVGSLTQSIEARKLMWIIFGLAAAAASIKETYADLTPVEQTPNDVSDARTPRWSARV